VIDLHAEAAADVRGDDADLVLGHAELARHEQPDQVRVLARQVEREGAGAEVGHAGARLDRRAGRAVVDDPALDHDVGLGPGRVHVAAADRPLVRLVGAELLVHERRPGLEGLLGVDHHGQRVVLDDDLLGGVDDAVLVAADDDGDGLADVLDDAVPGQRPRLRRLDLDSRRDPHHRERRLELEVVAGEDRVDARRLLGGRGVDRDDPGVRLGRPDDGHVEHPREHEVVHVTAAPGDHPGVLLATQRLADPLVAGRRLLHGAHAGTPFVVSAASSTALTMLW
jgi:hypothetical protein